MIQKISIYYIFMESYILPILLMSNSSLFYVYLYLFFSLCTCLCMQCACVYVCLHLCGHRYVCTVVCLWEPKADMRRLSQSFSTIFTEAQPLSYIQHSLWLLYLASLSRKFLFAFSEHCDYRWAASASQHSHGCWALALVLILTGQGFTSSPSLQCQFVFTFHIHAPNVDQCKDHGNFLSVLLHGHEARPYCAHVLGEEGAADMLRWKGMV